jgi:DNA-binding NtrC family response regulator
MAGATRVLIVDDEPELTTTLVERLQFRGFDCKGVTSGQEALEQMDRDAYDVVVLDVKMPGIGGIEVIERLKEKYPRTQVILLTGHSSAKTAESGLKLGAYEYVLKPVKLEILVEMIQKAAQACNQGDERS